MWATISQNSGSKRICLQEELSEKANVSRSIISGLESGRVKQTTVKTLGKIADALGVDISYFFTTST